MKKPSVLLAVVAAIGFALGLGAASASPIKPPIAAAWMYLSDSKGDYKDIPPEWSKIDFTKVDVLYVGPAGVQDATGTFGLYNSAATGDLGNRFRWVVQTARGQNANIKIIVSQWWGNGTGIWGDSLSALDTSAKVNRYTDTVAAFLKAYLPVSGGVDGYDIDYEDNNALSQSPLIISQVRTKLNALSKAEGGRPFYVTVSPAVTNHLDGTAPYLDYVNIQTYAGASGRNVPEFLKLGFKPQQLLYGICPETGCGGKSFDTVKAQYIQYKLVGIHLYRLNSDNYVEEGEMQAKVYKFLHP